MSNQQNQNPGQQNQNPGQKPGQQQGGGQKPGQQQQDPQRQGEKPGQQRGRSSTVRTTSSLDRWPRREGGPRRKAGPFSLGRAARPARVKVNKGFKLPPQSDAS